MASLLSGIGLTPHSIRTALVQGLNFALVLSTAFMLWKGLSVASNSASPIVVVLSGSMEPAFERGDLLFLWNRGADTQVGEIVVYNIRGKDIPIVHRVVERHGGGIDAEGHAVPLRLLTKGDNNAADDTQLYAEGAVQQSYLHRWRPRTDSDTQSPDTPPPVLESLDDVIDIGAGDVVGSVVGYVPFVGYGTILLSEYPWLKKVLLAVMGLGVVLQRE